MLSKSKDMRNRQCVKIFSPFYEGYIANLEIYENLYEGYKQVDTPSASLLAYQRFGGSAVSCTPSLRGQRTTDGYAQLRSVVATAPPRNSA
jgi:hypothetical protein